MPENETHDNGRPGSESFDTARKLNAGLARVARESEPERAISPEKSLQAIDGVIIDHRRRGNIELTGVLAEHTTRRVGVITKAMRSSQVLILEAEGTLTQEGREKFEATITEALAVQPDKAKLAALSSETAASQAHAQTPIAITSEQDFLPRLLSEFKGSGKQIRLIGTPPESDAYGITQDALHSSLEVATSVTDLEKFDPETIRQAVVRHTQIQARSYAAREQVMQTQIADIVDNLEYPAPVAVMVGAMHYRIMANIGEPAGDHSEQDVAKAVQDSITTPIETAVESIRDTGSVDDEVINRAVLHLCLRAYAADKASTNDAIAIINHLSPKQINQVLATLGNYRDESDTARRRLRISRHLATIASVTLHQIDQTSGRQA